jgi:hypothetical protein
MNASAAEPLAPTFTGFVQNSMDGLILFEACLSGKLGYLPRRPHDCERIQLIKSGNIFIYKEDDSGIKRWIDGVAWSPSRILGNFWIYRELDKPFPPGEKKRASKRKRSTLPGVDGFQRCNKDSQENLKMPKPITSHEPLVTSEQDRVNRSLIGSLVNSYDFRADGLVKKTMRIFFKGIFHRLVSYYKEDDVEHNKLTRPLQDPRLQDIFIRPELYRELNFRAPTEEIEYYAINQSGYADPRIMYRMAVDQKSISPGQYYNPRQHPGTYAHTQTIYPMATNWQNMRPGQYYPAGQHPGTYAPMTTGNAGHAAIHRTLPGTQWAQQPATTYAGHPSYTAAPSYGGHYGPGSQSETKPPESHATSQPLHHGNSSLAPYTGVQRDYSHSPSGTTLWSPYGSRVQLGLSTFGNTNAPTGRPAYIEGSDLIPTSDYQFRQVYSAPQGHQSFPLQQHALCPPSESYGMQGVLQSSTTQRSPHIAMESPCPAIPSSSTPLQTFARGPYRYGSHTAPHSAYRSSDTNSLGLGGGASYVHSYNLFG